MCRGGSRQGRTAIENDLVSPTAGEKKRALPIAKLVPENVMHGATLIQTSLCAGISDQATD